MTEYCQYCPCNLREKLYCGYYDFSRNLLKLDGLRDVKRRFDLLIQVNLIPFFPDYKIRNNKGELLIEHAYQYAAKIYRDRVDGDKKVPHLFTLMSIVTPISKEIKKLNIEHDDEIIVALLFHNVLYDTNVASGRIAKDYGEYTRTLVDRDAYRHEENLKKLIRVLEEKGLPEDMIATIRQLFKIDII
jgi:(p)ppGpp synthase/HD superfamily hydrolase